MKRSEGKWFVTPSTHTASFAYDPFGRRTSKTLGTPGWF